jgi:hypothetical protein
MLFWIVVLVALAIAAVLILAAVSPIPSLLCVKGRSTLRPTECTR